MRILGSNPRGEGSRSGHLARENPRAWKVERRVIVRQVVPLRSCCLRQPCLRFRSFSLKHRVRGAHELATRLLPQALRRQQPASPRRATLPAALRPAPWRPLPAPGSLRARPAQQPRAAKARQLGGGSGVPREVDSEPGRCKAAEMRRFARSALAGRRRRTASISVSRGHALALLSDELPSLL